jgi:hypothetical protein
VLQEMEKAKGTRGQLDGRDISGGYSLKPPEEEPPTYAEMDIRKRDAHNWQTIAAMPEEKQHLNSTTFLLPRLPFGGKISLTEQEFC